MGSPDGCPTTNWSRAASGHRFAENVEPALRVPARPKVLAAGANQRRSAPVVKHVTRIPFGKRYRCCGAPFRAESMPKDRNHDDAAKDRLVVQVRDVRPLPGHLSQYADPAPLKVCERTVSRR
jgi:hypothetical protein